ncbi:hypothetical protein [Sphaerimonospora thailandensis]|uniref:Uncharacterized protein n=1 Tax=Sphaerimonospora thailandensis TaxID=795644 RepID=A0A8J3RHX6_9ACTN|nr:hypothetical protein [Sphaerimonospora thailandensis]GIH72673.1 hypothetical protein Mth01_49260 [Sphaerimonospora thailandensis]
MTSTPATACALGVSNHELKIPSGEADDRLARSEAALGTERAVQANFKITVNRMAAPRPILCRARGALYSKDASPVSD